MNSHSYSAHIYIDKENPIISLVDEVLSDGSTVCSLHISGKQVHCLDRKRAKTAFLQIAAALNSATAGEVLVL